MNRRQESLLRGTIGRLLYWRPASPKRIQIGVTNLCNLNCTMCPRHDFGVKFKAMPYKQFTRIVDHLEGVVELDLTGWGESFTHKDVYKMIRYASDKGIKVSVTSNALLLDAGARKKLISSGLAAITFSVDSIDTSDGTWGHINRKGLENIKSLIKESDDIAIRLISTLHPDGLKDVLDVIRFAHDNNILQVVLSRLDLRFNKGLRRPSETEEKEIFVAAEKYGHRRGVEINFVPYAYYSGIKRLLYKLTRKWLHQGGKYCLKTYDYLFVNVEGKLTPCCALPNYVVGTLEEEDLKSLWNNDAMKMFRKKQRTVCGVCDTAMIKNLIKSGKN